MTVGVALLGVLRLAGRQRAIGPGSLTVILVVSTVVAHPGFLLPTGWRTGRCSSSRFVYAPAWAFLFDAGSRNRRSHDRAASASSARSGSRRSSSCSPRSRSEGGLVGPDRTNPLQALFGSVGRVMLSVPVAAVLVGALLFRRRGPVLGGAGGADRETL